MTVRGGKLTTDAAILIYGLDDPTNPGRIQVQARGSSSTFTYVYDAGTGSFRPGADNSQTNGSSAARWSVVYAGTAAINTSDAREKTEIVEVSEAESRVARKLKGMVRRFKFNDAVAEKGEGARFHIGLIAQEVKEAFEEEGLDANRYALLCYDEWDSEEDQFDNDGNITVHGRPAGNRYGIRYEELIAFIISAL